MADVTRHFCTCTSTAKEKQLPAKVAILMGSKNDWDKMKGAADVLTSFGIENVMEVMSAHRDPEKVRLFASAARSNGFTHIIAGAGRSNALSGAVAAHTRLPVIGVPLAGDNDVETLASLLATVEMPPGMPVTCVDVNGSKNAALIVISHLAGSDPLIDRKYRGFKERGSDTRAPMPTHSGKVRDTFEFPDQPKFLLQLVSDRISAFDHVLDTPIHGKGAVLADLTKFWLTQDWMREIVDNHYVDHATLPKWVETHRSRMIAVRRLDMIPLECIVRGYLEGSAWREYAKKGTMHGTPLPEGMLRCQKLPEPVFTPSTKAPEGEHDENISIEQATEQLGAELVERLASVSLELFRTASAFAEERGILILDTKFEFGWNPDTGVLTLADEVFTPDSSRFVDARTYAPGEAPASMDKEYVRQWLMKESGWDKESDNPPPPLPQHVVWETARRYNEIQRRLTGSAPVLP